MRHLTPNQLRKVDQKLRTYTEIVLMAIILSWFIISIII